MRDVFTRITGLWIIILPLTVFSQERNQPVNPDLKSYNFYLLSQWDSAAYYGNLALTQNTDHYYLRMRMGIAYYFQNNFFLATEHFGKALSFEPASLDAKKYLYHCYIFTNRLNQAGALIKRLNGNEKPYFPEYPSAGIQTFFISAGNKISDQKSIKGNQLFFSSGVSHLIKPGLQIHHQLTYLKQDLVKSISVNQFQYYCAASFYPHPRINIIPALHYLTLSDGYSRSNSLIKHLELRSGYELFSGAIFASHVGSISSGQRQAGLSMMVYPFGNLNLYHRLTATWRDDPESELKPSLVFNFMTGMKITSQFWLEAEGTVGKRTNFIESTAAVIHNTPDIMKERWSLMSLFLIGDHQSLFVKLISEHKTEYQNKKTFYHNGLYGGLQWTFLKAQ